jgi:hypothetical protein
LPGSEQHASLALSESGLTEVSRLWGLLGLQQTKMWGRDPWNPWTPWNVVCVCVRQRMMKKSSAKLLVRSLTACLLPQEGMMISQF